MASLGHVAVGMAAARTQFSARPALSSMAAWSALSLLPDVDVIGFALGVRYADPWGHRGATHSLAFAVALGAGIALLAPRFRALPLRTGLLATAVLVSHALLDTMTDGGLGCALLWPFDLTRYFAPWRPIPVAPIGLDFLSADGLLVSAAELLAFAPLIVFALRGAFPRRAMGVALLAVWLALVSTLAVSERAREAVVGTLLREDTAFTPGFSDAAFAAVAAGQSDEDVRAALGAPHRQVTIYATRAGEPPEEQPAIPAETARRLGLVAQTCWEYSWSPRDRAYRRRVVCFVDGRVHATIRHTAAR